MEGQSLHLTAPKTDNIRVILITVDAPIFATSITPIVYTGKGSNVEGENATMEARWQKFQLSVQIPLSDRKLSTAARDAFVNLYSWELMCKALSQLLLPF